MIELTKKIYVIQKDLVNKLVNTDTLIEIENIVHQLELLRKAGDWIQYGYSNNMFEGQK